MAAVSLTTPRRIRLGLALSAIAALAAAAVWVQHTDTPASVKATNVSTLPAAVQQTFVNGVRATFLDARGPHPVAYVRSTKGVAEPFIEFGDVTNVDLDKPVYVMYLAGEYNPKGVDGPAATGAQETCVPPPGQSGPCPASVTHNATPSPGSIVAIIGTDGQSYLVAGYGNTIPDLSKLGTPSTTEVDFGS